MSESRYDVAVAGAGLVGLAAALALARSGCRTCLVGPEPSGGDGRTVALLGPSVDLMETLGVWDALAPLAGALRAMRIVDDTDSLFRPPPVTFRASEIGLDAFGWNLENHRLIEVLATAARAEPTLVWHRDSVLGFDSGESARVELAGGGTVEASLVVAADGRRSRVREAAGIASAERRYRQAAFTAIFRHEREHEDASTEFHTRSGPFTLVPLPGRRSSLVWVTNPRHAARLREVDEAAVSRAAERAAHSILGRMELDGPRGVVPLVARSAAELTGPRLALAGETAHVLPPIGAQGLNLGFADVAALTREVSSALRSNADPGQDAVLARYRRARNMDTRMRSLAVDGLNRALLTGSIPIDAARGLGLGLLGQVGPLRRAVMRRGFPGRAPSPTLSQARAGVEAFPS